MSRSMSNTVFDILFRNSCCTATLKSLDFSILTRIFALTDSFPVKGCHEKLKRAHLRFLGLDARKLRPRLLNRLLDVRVLLRLRMGTGPK